MFLQLSLIQFTGGVLPQCMLGYHPLTSHPPEQTPPGVGTPLGAGIPPEQTPLPGADPPCTMHAGRYGQQAGGMYPTGMQSCFLLFVRL